MAYAHNYGTRRGRKLNLWAGFIWNAVSLPVRGIAIRSLWYSCDNIALMIHSDLHFISQVLDWIGFAVALHGSVKSAQKPGTVSLETVAIY